jgi:hypothetical protein
MNDGRGAESPAYPGVPRWVKILGVITLALAVVFVAVHLAGGGFRHHSHFGGEMPSGPTPKSTN